MFLDGLPQMLTPLGVGGAGAADVQAGLRKTLRAVLDVQVLCVWGVGERLVAALGCSMAREGNNSGRRPSGRRARRCSVPGVGAAAIITAEHGSASALPPCRAPSSGWPRRLSRGWSTSRSTFSVQKILRWRACGTTGWVPGRARGGKRLSTVLPACLPCKPACLHVRACVYSSCLPLASPIPSAAVPSLSLAASRALLLPAPALPIPAPQVIGQSPEIPIEVLREVGAGMGRVYALFDRHLRGFLTLLPAQSHLDLGSFLSRFEQVGGGGDAASGSAAMGME